MLLDYVSFAFSWLPLFCSFFLFYFIVVGIIIVIAIIAFTIAKDKPCCGVFFLLLLVMAIMESQRMFTLRPYTVIGVC